MGIQYLIVVDTGYAGIHHSKYWMPIHYDTIEDGQNKKSHLLFSKYKKIQELSLTLWPKVKYKSSPALSREFSLS